MNQVIIYGSQYGSTYRYAKQLSEQTNITAVSYKEAPDLSGMHTIQNGQKIILVTVGLADPNESENQDNIRTSLLYQSLHRTPPEKQTAENRALIETYGKQVDFTDLSALEPIIQEIRRGRYE